MKTYLSISLIAFFIWTGCQGQIQPLADTSHVVTYQQIADSAKAFVIEHDTDSGLEYHKRALSHARKHNLHEHEARSLVHIGLLLKGQDAEQSLLYLNNALQIAEQLNKHELRAEILKAISSVHKEQQNYSEALAELEAHQKLLQSVFEKNKREEATRLHAEELQKRERAVFLTIMVSLMLLTVTIAFYYTRTHRLNRALYKSNQIKDTLFSIIGHDLRGPAGGIMRVLEMLDTGTLGEQEEKKVIGALKQESHVFNETLDTLLNWASAQLKGAHPQVASVNALTSIQKSLDLLRMQANEKNVQVNLPNEDNLLVLADSDQLDFVVRNLISNAIKFSYPGGKIDITTEKKDNTAVIAIHDEGTGISESKQAELFEEGRLISTNGTKGEKGIGLGLMLSWDFVRANHGRIWFDSQEGGGTTFYLSLPLAF